MEHEHPIENCFELVLSPDTRRWYCKSEVKIMQGDHNSNRFVLRMPRYIQGHDMSLCTNVKVNYINIDCETDDSHEDAPDIDVIRIDEQNEDILIMEWKLSGNATAYAGVLNFQVHFVCMEGEEIIYKWHTESYQSFVISKSIKSTESIPRQYPDVLLQWEARMENLFERVEQGGLDGESAYQIAVKHGFVGTEEDYLESLHGRDGKDGKDGASGKDGHTPAKGVDYFTDEDKKEIADTVPKEVFAGTRGNEVDADGNHIPATTWDELVEAYESDKFIIIKDNQMYYVLSTYAYKDAKPYMYFTAYNMGAKSMYALHINASNKWTSVSQRLIRQEDLDANGKGVFVAEHGVTTFEELREAYEAGKMIFVKIELDTNDDDLVSQPLYLAMTYLYHVNYSEGAHFNIRFEGIYANRLYMTEYKKGNVNAWESVTYTQIALSDSFNDYYNTTTSDNRFQPKGNYATAAQINALKGLLPLIKWMQNTAWKDNGTYYNSSTNTFTMKSNALCIIRGNGNVLNLTITASDGSTYALTNQNIIILFSSYYALNGDCEVFGAALKKATLGLPGVETFGVGCRAKSSVSPRAIDCVVVDSDSELMNVMMLDIPVKEEMKIE